MPFNNDIAGGNGQLVRNWIQSVNFVAGVSGWRISKDGNAEFNNGTFRGSIEVGPIPGQHFIVNNPSTGDVVDIYNGANQLVLKIDSFGAMTTFDTPLDTVVVAGNGIGFGNQNTPPSFEANIIGSSTSTDSSLQFDSGASVAGFGDMFMTLFDSNFPAGGGSSGTRIETRSTPASPGIQGALVHTDIANNQNNIIHVQTYNVATDPGGTGTFNHNCPSTPKFGWLVGVNGIGANFPYQYAWFANPFTSITAKAAFKDNLGAALANTTLGVMGIFLL